MHQQVDLPVHRNCHLSGYDIVLGIRVMGRIKPKEVGVCLVDLVGVQGPELSIWTRVAEIKRELSGLHLDGHSVRRGWGEIHAGPSFGSEHTQRQNLRTN